MVKEGWLLKKGGGGSDGNERNWAKVVSLFVWWYVTCCGQAVWCVGIGVELSF